MVVDNPPLSLRGRPVAVPATCEASVIPGGGQVQRGAGQVLWVHEDEARAQTRADAMRRMIATIIRAEAPEPDERPCRLAGVRTTCYIWLMKTADGQVLGATAHVLEGSDVDR